MIAVKQVHELVSIMTRTETAITATLNVSQSSSLKQLIAATAMRAAVHPAVINVYKLKSKKAFVLFKPTQLFTHGQW